jgi:hypothetical protein
VQRSDEQRESTLSALDPTASCSTAAQGRRGQRPSRLWFYGIGVELGPQWHFSPPAAVTRDLRANQRCSLQAGSPRTGQRRPGERQPQWPGTSYSKGSMTSCPVAACLDHPFPISHFPLSSLSLSPVLPCPDHGILAGSALPRLLSLPPDSPAQPCLHIH